MKLKKKNPKAALGSHKKVHNFSIFYFTVKRKKLLSFRAEYFFIHTPVTKVSCRGPVHKYMHTQ